MSHNPPPYYGYPAPGGPPPHHGGHQLHHGGPPPHHGGPPPHHGGPPPGPGAFTYVPAPVMMPVYPPPPSEPVAPPPTFVTNYIYQPPVTEPQPPPQQTQPEYVEDDIDWVEATPTTVSHLQLRALVAGKEGWDGSPLWVIRAHHSGEFIPGKLAVKHNAAYIPYAGKEVPVHNFEVLLAKPHAVRWLPSSNGQVPVGAIAAGNTHKGEPLYIARVKHANSITPGKVHPSHGCCYISFGGAEVSHKYYEVLCKIVG